MVYIELLIAVALILINGVLAMSELAVVSARRGRLKAMADGGSRGATAALRLADDPGRFLSTVQIGITLVGILAGAFSGATLGARLTTVLVDSGMPLRFAEPLAYGGVVALITYLSLIVGELVPKQIALRNAEAVAASVAPGMTMLARISAPLVWLLDVSGKAILRLLGGRQSGESSVTAEEIKSLIADGESSGAIEPRERGMISAVMRLGDRPARADHDAAPRSRHRRPVARPAGPAADRPVERPFPPARLGSCREPRRRRRPQERPARCLHPRRHAPIRARWSGRRPSSPIR